MRETTMDILLRMGIPASVKGLTYICDAVEPVRHRSLLSRWKDMLSLYGHC